MILKWFILAVIAWYVLRAARNLMIAIQQERTIIGRSDAPIGNGARRGNDGPRGNGGSASKASESARKKDVEDARFQDLS